MLASCFFCASSFRSYLRRRGDTRRPPAAEDDHDHDPDRLDPRMIDRSNYFESHGCDLFIPETKVKNH